MRAAPPARRVSWESAVATPKVTLIVFEAEEICYVFGEADSFKDAHVFAATEHECLASFCVDAHNRIYDAVVFGLGFLAILFVAGTGGSPDRRGRCSVPGWLWPGKTEMR